MREDRPSSTAALIAAATVFLAAGKRTRALVPEGAPGWCERCLASASPLRLALVRGVSHPLLRWLPLVAERLTVPGLMRHFMARKRWIEAALCESLQRGASIVVVVGAGFDTLALRLAPRFPAVRFIEIDHPATQAIKRRAIEAPAAPGNLHLVAADLSRQDISSVLATIAAYDTNAGAVFVIEGLLMYLTAEQVRTLFASIRRAHRGPLRIIFTVMEPTPDGRSAFHNATSLTRWLLGRWSEPFRSALARSDAAAFVAPMGLQVETIAKLDGERLAVGEIVIAAKGAAS
ncbi:MAG TPA: class I SAM-dependent methyltransferase [Usitatibacter sp.]|nr:class I SAM-dependent methyltransferase [Usitatibacter sp.]